MRSGCSDTRYTAAIDRPHDNDTPIPWATIGWLNFIVDTFRLIVHTVCIKTNGVTDMTDHKFDQIIKVRQSYDRSYVVYETVDDDGKECFDVYEDDGEGNGTQVARGYNIIRIRSMVLCLGEFIEWRAGVPVLR
jgi:hypothetical protein